MPLYGIRVLIWTGGGAAGRGCALVTLSLNCSFDFQRENSQSEGDGTPNTRRLGGLNRPPSAQTPAKDLQLSAGQRDVISDT